MRGDNDFPNVRRDNNFDNQYGRNNGDSIWNKSKMHSKENLDFPASGLEDSNVIITEPRTNEDLQNIIDNLKKGEAVIVDLQSVANDSSQRILDILSGAVYGLSGSLERLKDRMFILTPAGVSIKSAGIQNAIKRK